MIFNFFAVADVAVRFKVSRRQPNAIAIRCNPCPDAVHAFVSLLGTPGTVPGPASRDFLRGLPPLAIARTQQQQALRHTPKGLVEEC
jgi:hypothetical protein